ncbi:MAG: hypothetical protein QOE58_3122 [Actinomycetota bacterium]|jgi:hypothetical protein|nr:hypothetical protein [Actinomycetota bacterium]
MGTEKRQFLVCYDYGMGGIWGVFMARSQQEILDVYPELVVVLERPKWMTEQDYLGLCDRELHDIDGAPWGILNAVLADRDED